MTPSESVAREAAEAVANVRRAVAELDRAVALLRSSGYGDTLGVRRLTSDVRRLADDLDELGPPAPSGRAPTQAQALEVVPEGDYDPSLWVGAEDEGLGGTRP
jgi:hypothetical protein